MASLFVVLVGVKDENMSLVASNEEEVINLACTECLLPIRFQVVHHLQVFG